MGIYIGISLNNRARKRSQKFIQATISIVDDESKLPLIDAVVIFDGRKYLTDSSGQVILSGIENKKYLLTVQKRGYSSITIQEWELREDVIYLSDITRNILAEVGINILTEREQLILLEI